LWLVYYYYYYVWVKNNATVEKSSLSNLTAILQLDDTPFSKFDVYFPLKVTKACVCFTYRGIISLLATFCALFSLKYNIYLYLILPFLSTRWAVDSYCDTWSHSVTHTLSLLLWTRDRPIPETTIWRHTTLTRYIYALRQDSNPQLQQASGGRPAP
jgi:hypothetical protein